MDLGMAVCATPVEIPHGIQDRRSRWVTSGDVARIAHARHAHLQQLRVVGAMRFVAVGAVLHDRRVLPEEWTAPLRVAGQAVFVHCALDELLWVGRPVRVVTTGAGDLAFAVRHVRRALQLGAPHLVALQTELRLGLPDAPVLGERGVVTNFGGNCPPFFRLVS